MRTRGMPMSVKRRRMRREESRRERRRREGCGMALASSMRRKEGTKDQLKVDRPNRREKREGRGGGRGEGGGGGWVRTMQSWMHRARKTAWMEKGEKGESGIRG